MDTKTSDPGAGVFVWSVWGVMLATALFYALLSGADAPIWDDYAVVPQLCGRAPVDMAWLWSQHSEHRIPLARLVLLTVFRLDGADPRPVMALNAALLGAAAAALLVAVGRFPEGRRYSDAFLPLALLGPAHHENLLWAIQITYVAPAALLCFALSLVATSGERPGLRRCGLVALCLAILPLCNAGGLLMVPPLALWLGAAALGHGRSDQPGGRGRALLIAAATAPALLLMALYLWGYVRPSHHAAPGGPAASLRATAQFLATALGSPGSSLWPLSGAIVAGAMVGAFAALVRAWLTEPRNRWSAGGVLCALGAVAALAVATGWGRSGEGPSAGLQPRYATLAAPALAVVYLAFARFGSRISRRLVPMVLFAGFCSLIWPSAEEALRAGRVAKENSIRFRGDLAAGEPLYRLVRRHVPWIHPSQEAAHAHLEMLRAAGVGKFRTMRSDPPFEERRIDLDPDDVRLARWSGQSHEITALGVDPWVRFDLPAPARVAGVRIRYDHQNDDGAPAHFRLAWRSAGQLDFPADQQYGDWNLPTGSNRTTTVWIDQTIAQIRLQPDNRPCRFRIHELTLLLAP